MQPYRQAKPHIGTDCPHCAPTAPGHQQCQHDGCEEPAETQHHRHATAAEYATLPAQFQPIDGIAHQAVFTCGDHDPDPICDTADHITDVTHIEPDPCPKCGTAGHDQCTKANGKPRTTDHAQRSRESDPVTTYNMCSHVHREDCGGQDACACTSDDPAPERPKRIVEPPPPPGPAPIHMPTHGPVAELLAQHGIDISRVLTLDLQTDGKDGHVIHAVMAVLDNRDHHRFDNHGHLLTEEADVPFELIGPTNPAKI